MSGGVGLVGVGPISDWHVRALRAAGLEVTAVSSRTGSTRVHDFARRHGIPRVYASWLAMLDEPAHWDALVIATHTDGTADVLSSAMGLKVPILVEKPVGWTAARVAELAAGAHSRVLVGFNRRFYRPVQFLREAAIDGPPALAHLSLPEAIHAGGGGLGRPYWAPFVSNSCHGLDMVRFVFGPLRIESVSRLTVGSGEIGGLSALLVSRRGDLIQLTGNWGAPANFALTLDRPGRRVELRPFEVATVYEELEVVEPSDDCPVRRYVPRVKERVHLDEVDCREKPGFVPQAMALRALIDGEENPEVAATLDDAAAAVRLCEELLGTGPRPRAGEADDAWV